MVTIAVIPAYNESARISPVISRTQQYVDKVIVVDDHSRDNTLAVAKQAGATAVRLATNMGAGFATRVGCDIAVEQGADIMVTLDADGQHDPSEIPKLIKPLKEVDIVFGSRPRNESMPAIKRIGNWGLSLACRLLFGIGVKDSQTGYHAFTKEAYEKIRWTSNRYGVVSEFVANVAKANLSYTEVEVKTIYNEKRAGMRKRDAVKSIINMISWRLKRW